MANRKYTIVVSAALDRGVTAAVQDLVGAFTRASKIIDRETAAAGRKAGENIKAGLSAAAQLAIKAAADQERAAKRAARETEQAAKRAASEVEKAAKQQANAQIKAAKQAAAEVAKAEADKARAAERGAKLRSKATLDAFREERRARDRDHADFLRNLKDEEREAKKAKRAAAADARSTSRVEGGRKSAIKGMASDAMGTFGRVASKAMGLAGEITAGTGVSFDVSSSVGKSVELESLATSLSNAAFKKGGPRESVTGLIDDARSIGNQYGFDPKQILSGMGAYQEKTGDLATGKAGLPDLAKLAKATSTDLADMVSAAADVGSALGDVGKAFKTPEEKAKRIYEVMKMVAGQGQEGAVEVKALAVQMAKISSSAGFFAGDRGKNIEKLGALAQLSRQMGGAASSSQAANSVAAFVNQLRTPARLKQFADAGVDVYSKKKGEEGKILNPFDIIKQSLVATNADPGKMKKLFMSVLGDKPVTALAQVYNDTKGTKKDKLAAVDAQLARFTTPMDDSAIDANAKAAMGTKESRAQVFQNKFDVLIAAMADKAIPALEKLEPIVLKAVDALGKMVGWAVDNPTSAIATALAGSVAKAVISNKVSGLGDSLAGGAASSGGVGGMSGLGAVGAALTTIAVSYALFKVGSATIDMAAADVDKGVDSKVSRDAEIDNAITAALVKAQKGDAIDPKEIADLEGKKAELQKSMAAAKDPTSFMGALFTDKTFEQYGREQSDAKDMQGLQQTMERVEGALKALRSGTLKTEVTNMPAPGFGAPAGTQDALSSSSG